MSGIGQELVVAAKAITQDGGVVCWVECTDSQRCTFTAEGRIYGAD
jgi:hypothetical protein